MSVWYRKLDSSKCIHEELKLVLFNPFYEHLCFSRFQGTDLDDAITTTSMEISQREYQDYLT